MLPENTNELVQKLQDDINQMERGLEEWLKSLNVRSKKIPAHYVHITHPIQEALSQLANPDIDAVVKGQAIQSILDHVGGFFHLFELLEAGLEAKMPDIFFSLKDNLYDNAVKLRYRFGSGMG